MKNIVNKQNYMLKFTRLKDFTPQCIFIQLELLSGTEALEPHMGFYSLNIQYIFIYLSTIRNQKKLVTLELEKHLALYLVS